MSYDDAAKSPGIHGAGAYVNRIPAQVHITVSGTAEEVMEALTRLVLGGPDTLPVAAPAYAGDEAVKTEVAKKAQSPKSNGKAKAKAEAPRPEPEDDSGSADGAAGEDEGEEAETEAEAPQDPASAVALEKLKTETLDRLKDLFVAGKGKFVRDLLMKHGHGAKVFPEVEARWFPAISADVDKELR